LGVPGAELLENRLKHLRLLLDNLTKLLELSVISEEIQIAEVSTSTLPCSCRSGGGSSSSSTSSASTTGPAGTTPLGSEVEKVHVAVVINTSSLRSWSRRS
jgi:hypothetical protein